MDCFGTDFQPVVFVVISNPETSSPVTQSIGFQPNHLRWISAYSYPRDQRFWLEASTLSNRGEMRQHLPTGYGHTPHRWLEASTTLSKE